MQQRKAQPQISIRAGQYRVPGPADLGQNRPPFYKPVRPTQAQAMQPILERHPTRPPQELFDDFEDDFDEETDF